MVFTKGICIVSYEVNDLLFNMCLLYDWEGDNLGQRAEVALMI